MILDCLRDGFREAVVELGLGELGELLIGAYVISFVAAVALGPFVLWLYQRRVEKLMTTRGDGAARDKSSEVPRRSTARARQLFVLDRDVLRRRLDDLRSTPADPDSRYRIHEFFCLDDVWREAVDALVDVSDVVLLDLRGFDASRRGTAFEVTLLARKNALDRTLCLIDEKTDPAAVTQALAAVPGAEIPADRVLRAESSVDSTDVLRALARIEAAA